MLDIHGDLVPSAYTLREQEVVASVDLPENCQRLAAGLAGQCRYGPPMSAYPDDPLHSYRTQITQKTGRLGPNRVLRRQRSAPHWEGGGR